MRDVKRIDVMIELLRIAWHNNPDMRLGQLVSNIVDGRYPKITRESYRTALRLMEDDRMQAAMVEFNRKD
jgi:uncharacterized protein YihD (DUF1040 family)